jgi:hypothetical protein
MDFDEAAGLLSLNISGYTNTLADLSDVAPPVFRPFVAKMAKSEPRFSV